MLKCDDLHQLALTTSMCVFLSGAAREEHPAEKAARRGEGDAAQPVPQIWTALPRDGANRLES